MAERAQIGVLGPPLHNLCVSLGLSLLSGKRTTILSVCIFCKVDSLRSVLCKWENKWTQPGIWDLHTYEYTGVYVLCFDITMISIQAAHILF